MQTLQTENIPVGASSRNESLLAYQELTVFSLFFGRAKSRSKSAIRNIWVTTRSARLGNYDDDKLACAAE